MTSPTPTVDRADRSGPLINRRWFTPATGTSTAGTSTTGMPATGGSAGGARATGDRPSSLVLLHEGLGSIAAWGEFPQDLADRSGRAVLAYDRVGYGDSAPCPKPWPADFMHHEARALGRLLAEEGVDNPILVGHSDGATIALLHPSQAHPGAPSIVGIVSISAHVFVEEVGAAAIEAMRAGYEGRMAMLLSRYHDDADATFDAWSEVWVSERFRPWTIDDELGAVTCPVLAMQGAADGYGTAEQLDRVVAAVNGPSERHDLAGIDHWPHKEAPSTVIDLITTFCDRLDGDPALRC